MGTFSYELRRTLSSKTVIILTAAVIAISVFSAINTATSSPGPIGFNNSVAYGYGSNGSYSIVVYIHNGFGQPIQGSRVIVGLGNSSTLTGTSDAMGYANFTLSGVNSTVIENPSNSTQWGLPFNYTTSRGMVNFGMLDMYSNYSNPYFFSISYSYKLPNGTLYNKSQDISRYSMNSVSVPNQPTKSALDVLYEGDVSQGSPEVLLYVMPVNGTIEQNGYSVGYSALNISEQNMTYFGTYRSFSHVELNPKNLTGSNVNYYVFALFTPSGKLLTSLGLAINTPEQGNQVSEAFYGTQMSIMGLFIPLIAAVSAYATYGKDKTLGVLESVLARPVSRKGLILSRYLANLSAVFAATFVAFLVSSLVYGIYLGNRIPADTFLSGLWSLFAASAAYIGLVYMASNFTKSSGALLGFAIGIFIVFDFLWTFAGADLIPFLITSLLLHIPSGSLQYVQSFVDLYYISPAGLPNITSLIITGSAYSTIYARSSEFVQVGLTYFNVILIGILWSVVPLVLSVIAFVKRG
ncbi:hypothetical protein IX51_00920 [uncultured archaeon]|nr:hypothetical protein IX51_00920 [uncultured archaeon]